MKPLRLEVRGFTAFRDPAVVEFEQRQLFVITGPTGAGKSSLLDAMIWALYGQVPRVGAATRQLVTHGEKSMAVRFDFTALGETYRVSRHAPGGIGARMERLTESGEWHPLADRSREVTARVTQLLGLDYQTFTKTIVLPQGAFDSFLRGDERDRRAILTRLLGLDTYEEAGRAARARARGATELAEALRRQLERLELATPGALASLEQERARLEVRLAEVEQRRKRLAELVELARAAEEAGRALESARESAASTAAGLREAEQALAHAERTLAAEQRHSAEISHERIELGYDADRHRRLRELGVLLEQQAGARAAVDASCAALEAARAAEERAGGVAEERRREAAVTSGALNAASAVLSLAAGRADEVVELLGAEAVEADRARAGSEEEANAHERRAQSLDALARRAETQAAERVDAERVAQRAGEARTAAAGAHGEATAALRGAEATAVVRREAFDNARTQDAAATLQRALKPGDPCPVCGAPIEHVEAHPAPDLDAAATALAEAERTLETARAARERLTTEAVRATASAEHADRARALAAERLADLDGELEAAEVERAEAPRAVEDALRCAAAAHARTSQQQRRGEQARAAERELSLLLAKVPSGVERAVEPAAEQERDSEGATAAPAALLRDALAQHQQAAAESQVAARGTREAEERLRAEQAAAARARPEHARASEALEAAEQRLATISASDAGSVEEASAALAAMEQQADRARELDAAAREAEAACAAAAARGDGRCRDHRRAAELADGRRADAAAAGQQEQRARAAFEQGRGEVVGAGSDGHDEPAGTGALAAMLAGLEREGQEAAQALGAVGERLDRARREAEEAARTREQIAGLERSAGVAGALEQELHGDRFIAYVQREALQVLAADASLRLRQLSNGRYRLIMDGDEFAVVDRLNGDERRSVKTLSGGETFLASLSLSLALSERLPELAGTGGAVSLESLFLDEGFGSLDSQSLEVAIEGLEALAGGQRMVGVISHVPQLAERLQDRIEVVRTDRTSLIRG